ncbi:hypothetical protein [Actinomadura vinacea]
MGGPRRRPTSSTSPWPARTPKRRPTSCAHAASRCSRSRGNYYDDIAARTDLAPGTIKELREARVMYDQDGTGEFVHFYTATLGRRLFFEIVQRLSGYDGYGAANTPVRMAAQYRQLTGFA